MPALPELPGVEHRFVAAGDVRLHVALAGDPQAPPLVLVHGWPQHWWIWRKVLPALAERHRVVMPDLRGHGWSDAPRRGYDKGQLAADLLALLDALDLQRVTYAGHDWGAWSGFLLATRAPERIASLVNFGVPHPWPGLRTRVNPLTLGAMSYQVPLALTGRGARQILRLGGGRDVYDDADVELYDAVLRERPWVTQALYRTSLLRDIPAALAGRYDHDRLTMPVRLVVGTRDPVSRGARSTDRIAVEHVRGAGHFLPEERPDLVRGRILQAAAPA